MDRIPHHVALARSDREPYRRGTSVTLPREHPPRTVSFYRTAAGAQRRALPDGPGRGRDLGCCLSVRGTLAERSRRPLVAPTGQEKPIPLPRLPNHQRQSRVPARRPLQPEICSLLTQQQHLKQSRLPRQRFRSAGLCRSLLTHMTIRRRLRRLAPVCLQVRELLRKPPWEEVIRLR